MLMASDTIVVKSKQQFALFEPNYRLMVIVLFGGQKTLLSFHRVYKAQLKKMNKMIHINTLKRRSEMLDFNQIATK